MYSNSGVGVIEKTLYSSFSEENGEYFCYQFMFI